MDDSEGLVLSDRDKNKKKTQKAHDHWPMRVFLMAVALSAVLSFCSSTVLTGASLLATLLVLVVFVGLGIVFDMIGVAVTAADPKPFHSMACLLYTSDAADEL